MNACQNLLTVRTIREFVSWLAYKNLRAVQSKIWLGDNHFPLGVTVFCSADLMISEHLGILFLSYSNPKGILQKLGFSCMFLKFYLLSSCKTLKIAGFNDNNFDVVIFISIRTYC